MPKYSPNNELLKERMPVALARLKEQTGVSWYRLESVLHVSNGDLHYIRHGKRLPAPMQMVRLALFAHENGMGTEFLKTLGEGPDGAATPSKTVNAGLEEFRRLFKSATSGR